MRYDDNLDQLHRIQIRDRFHLVTDEIAEMRGKLAALIEQQKTLKSRLGGGRKSDNESAHEPGQPPAHDVVQDHQQAQRPGIPPFMGQG